MVKLPSKHEWALDYLVRRKFPRANVRWSSLGSAETDEEDTEEVEAYRKELEDIPPDVVIRTAGEALTREREAEEAEADHNQPWAMADTEHWARAAYWTLEEAVWLTLDRDPRRVKASSFPVFPVSPLKVRFEELSELVRRAKLVGQLFEPVLPGLFLTWARRSGIEYPIELEKAVAKYGHEMADWKARHDEAVAALENANEQLAKDREILATLEKRLTNTLSAATEVCAERDELRFKLESQLDTRSRETLLKMLIGMAVKGYGHDPRAGRTTTAKEISDDLERLGISVSDDTVRKWLSEAAELLPPRETE